MRIKRPGGSCRWHPAPQQQGTLSPCDAPALTTDALPQIRDARRGACAKSNGCAGGAVAAVDCCLNADGCLTGLTLRYSAAGAAPLAASCDGAGGACDAAAGGARVTLDGELISNVTVETKKWGSGRCVAALTMVTRSGTLKRCGAPAAAAAAPTAAVPGLRRLRRELLALRPKTLRPGRAPSCLRQALAPDSAVGGLCTLKPSSCTKNKETGGSALARLSAAWAFQGASQCAYAPADVKWSCPAQLDCSTAGASVPLSGLCTSSVPGAAIAYAAGPAAVSAATVGAAAVGAAACPVDDVATVVAPSLVLAAGVPAACAVVGPVVKLRNTASFKVIPSNGGSDVGFS
jgi:hypothetical protein